jgi:hypothetical protein
MKLRSLASLAGTLFGLAFFGVAACSASGADEETGGAGGDGAGASGGASGNGGSGASIGLDGSAGTRPSQECGYAQIPTQREPGALLIVFDASSSMEQDARGKGPTEQGYDPDTQRWKVTANAIHAVVDQLSDDAAVGLLVFPNQSSDQCDVQPTPAVPIAPLASTRDLIKGRLTPDFARTTGSVTPMPAGIRAGHDYLATVEVPGQKAIVLLTDGAPVGCAGANEANTIAAARDALTNRKQRTYAVGIDLSDSFLSQTAAAGGGARNATCVADCCPGLLGCTAPAQSARCCHYAAAGTAALAAALSEIAGKALSSCVFNVPRGNDPSRFDPNQVNVVVSVEGGPQQTLVRDQAPGWSYVPGTGETKLVINGSLCDELLAKSSTVEVLLGCPTVVQ